MISAIVLAAGRSVRMGKNKLLLNFRGRTLVERTVDALLLARVAEVIVVLGHDSEKVKNRLDGRAVKFVYNPKFASGQSTSVQAGVLHVSPRATGLLLALADQPFVETADLDVLINAFSEASKEGKNIVVPMFAGKRGNPVILSVVYREDILRITGDKGCREIIRREKERVFLAAMSTDHVLRDVDTMDEYHQIAELPQRE